MIVTSLATPRACAGPKDSFGEDLRQAWVDDYLYDKNGNMTVDKNKDIASIEYNHLNLPSKVTKNNGEYLKYIYTASGAKLSQVVYNASDVQQKKSDYLGEFFYENDTLRFINHEEGRVVIAENDEEYQYTLKDHLGNIRITFTTKEEVDNLPATMDTGNESAEQERFGAYNSFTNQALDPTPAESAGDKILILNGSTLPGGSNGQVGLTRSFAVVPGDVVTATVNAKYETGSGQGNLAGFAAALTQAFLLTPGPEPTEGITPFEALNAFGTAIASGGRDGDENLPQGFLNILVFDKEYNLVDAAFKQVGTSTALTATLEIRQPGFVYVFLSNDGAAQQQIGFDNYSIDHTHSPVIQSQDYYAFGLTYNSYSRENTVPNDIKFQGQEHQDELGLNWDSFKWRNHQPDIGRFFNVDPLAEKYYYNSPYAFSENKVVAHVELEGLESAPYPLKQELNKLESRWNSFKEDMKQLGKDIKAALTIPKDPEFKKVDEIQSDQRTSTDLEPFGGPNDAPFNADAKPHVKENDSKTVNTTEGGQEGATTDRKDNSGLTVKEVSTNGGIDTVATSGNVDQHGNIYNKYFVIKNGKDTIDERGYVPDNMMPKKIVPATNN